MELSTTNIDSTTVVSIVGSVDAMTAAEVTNFLAQQIYSGTPRMVADLSQVDFISSAGLRAVMSATKDTRKQGGDFRLAAPRPGVAKVLRISGFISILKTFSTVAEAIGSFNSVASMGEAGQ
jgi:anti-sigma B factor antagonist